MYDQSAMSHNTSGDRMPGASSLRPENGNSNSGRFLAEAGAFVMRGLRWAGENLRAGVEWARARFARRVGGVALDGVEASRPEDEPTPPPLHVEPPGMTIPVRKEKVTSFVGQDRQDVAASDFSYSPLQMAVQPASPRTVERTIQHEQEDRSVWLKRMLLMAKARQVRLMREQGDPTAPSDDELLAYFLMTTDDNGKWDDHAVNTAFDAFSRVLYPDEVVPEVESRAASVFVAPVAPYRTPIETRSNPRRWIVAGVVGAVALAGAIIGLKMVTGDHSPAPGPTPTAASATASVSPSASPSVSASPSPSVSSRLPGPASGGESGGSEGENEEVNLKAQTLLQGAETDEQGDFVRMTAYSDRHEGREKGRDFSTVWWIAGQQLDVVNGSAEPTVPEIWEFTDQTLKHNLLTWKEARRLQVDQKIRLLSDTAAKQVIETVK